MKRIALLVLLLLAMGLVACGGGEEEAAEQDVTVTATDIAYSTDRIEVTAGQPVVLTLQNEGALAHDFSIIDIPLTGQVIGAEEEGEMEHEMTMPEEELDLHNSAAAGESATITFTPSEPGEYQYFCTVPGHKDAGMVGTLVVQAP